MIGYECKLVLEDFSAANLECGFQISKFFIFQKPKTDLNEICYSGVLGPNDFESEVRISKFKMTDLIWRIRNFLRYKHFKTFYPFLISSV